MNPNKALWEKGDFTHIAASMRESGEALVDGFGMLELVADQLRRRKKSCMTPTDYIPNHGPR